MLQVQSPFQQFFDTDGSPLDNGSIFIGLPNLNPIAFPAEVFWDADGTIPAAQPIKTSNGYAVRAGTPARIYIDNIDYSITVKNRRGMTIFTALSVTAVTFDVLSAPDGASRIGFIQDATGAVATTVENKLRETKSVKDFGAQGDGVTDDFAALTAAHASGFDLYYPYGNYLTSGAINVLKGTIIRGDGGGRFTASTSRTSTVTCTAAGVGAFRQTLSTSSLQEDGMSIYDMVIVSDNPITLNDPTVLIADGGASPPLMKSRIVNVTFTPVVVGAGVGLSMSKCFDFTITGCEFGSHGTQLLMQGCDIGSVHTNRFANMRNYGILELGVSTFGSQNDIHNNDMVAGIAATEFFRSTSRHVRFYNNYLEQASGTCAVFVRLSATGIPTFGPNATSTTRFSSVVVKDNRIDGHANATGGIYILEPVGVSAFINDVGTTGPLSTLPWLIIEGEFLPLFRNTVNGCFYDFFGGSQINSAWKSFKTQPVNQNGIGFGFNNLSLLGMNNSELRRNNSHLEVDLSETSIRIKKTLSNNFHCVFPIIKGDNNRWMRSGVTYNVTVIANSRFTSSELRILRVVNAGAVGLPIDTVLDAQPKAIKFTMAGALVTDTVGLAFSVLVATDDIEIRSVFFSEV